MSNQHSKCDDCYKTHLPEVHDRTILPSEAFSKGYVPEFNQASEDEPSKSDYFPYLDRDEKITAYKRALHQSLDLAVHPDHLKRVRVKLNALEKFWKSEWSKSK